MKVWYDLHIHSCLSPCSQMEMTPNNIINMALLKNLDIIAITDHNSLENFKAVSQYAKDKDIIVVPGMEVETREEVHLICLFKTFESALIMQEKIYEKLPQIKNRPDIFGPQVLMDCEDNEAGLIDRMLLTAADISVNEVFDRVKALGGVVLPAHVDRKSYSLLSNLGMIPEDLKFKYLEISRNCDLDAFKEKYPELKKYKFIKSSDAHDLGSILERESFLELEELSIEELINKLGGIP